MMTPLEANADEDQAKLIYATETPDLDALIRLYQRATPIYDRYHRILHSDDVRLNRWSNKNVDGKKYSTEDEEAFPFEGASDSECFLADAAINEQTALLVVAFWRSVVQRISGTEAGDYEQAANLNRLMEWLMQTQLHRDLHREVELSAQYFLTYGYVLLHPTWERRISRRRGVVTFEMMVEFASQHPPDEPLAMLPQMILDPETEGGAAELIGMYLRPLLAQYFEGFEIDGVEVEELMEHYSLSKERLRRFVRGLRTKGRAELPVPYFAANKPCVTAMKIGEDAFLPNFASDIQNTEIFVRVFMTEQQLRSRGALEGWNKDWVEEAAKRRGMQSTWSNDLSYDKVTDDAWEFTWLDQQTSGHDLIEVVFAYNWRLDEDKIPQRYYTVFHADITRNQKDRPLYAHHGLVDYDHEQMPFVIGMREWRSRNFNSSRGIPIILRSRQRLLKTFYDGLIDFQSMTLSPPLNTYDAGMGAKYIYGPGAQNPVTPGREPHHLDIPTKGAPLAFELVDALRRDVDNELGLLSEHVLPTRATVMQQMLVNKFLSMWTEALQQVFGLVEQYVPQAEFQRITGSTEPLPRGTEIAAQHDFILTLDVRTIDMEHVLKEFKAIAEAVRPLDAEGVIDMGRLVKTMVRAINPSLAREIIKDKQSATAELQKRTEGDLLRMMGGFEPQYGVDDNPAAEAQLQIVQQIAQTNPKIQKALQEDQQFAEMLQKYVQNLEFGLQQQQNKQIGRVGVS